MTSTTPQWHITRPQSTLTAVDHASVSVSLEIATRKAYRIVITMARRSRQDCASKSTSKEVSLWLKVTRGNLHCFHFAYRGNEEAE
jgi:hypothetical protein